MDVVRGIVSHHPAILSVSRDVVAKPAGFIVDLVGARTRVHYFPRLTTQGEAPFESRDIIPPLPPYDENYFEWVDVLESVRAASGRYVVCELGAGWGRWSMRAACAIRQLNPMPFKCIAVEGEPQHFRWMREHFADNGLNPDDHELVWAAAGPTSGVTPFATGEAGTWYGQSMCDGSLPPLDARARRLLRARGLLGRPPRTSGERGVCWVPMVSLWELVADEPHIDLLDLDIQGSELAIVEAAAPLIERRVRRVHIGTHSREVEAGLRDLFRTLEWECVNDYSCQSVTQTPYGEISFRDGVQTWVNSNARTQQSR